MNISIGCQAVPGTSGFPLPSSVTFHVRTQSVHFPKIKSAQVSLSGLIPKRGTLRNILFFPIFIPHATALLLIKGNLTNGI